MGKWSISELDKNKTEQSITNEQTRIDMCREKLDKLINERDRYKAETDIKLWEYYDKIEKLTKSIESGEKFVEDCKNHLNDFN
jgi:DNA repair exonuclease SbcCD ATPase subunit